MVQSCQEFADFILFCIGKCTAKLTFKTLSEFKENTYQFLNQLFNSDKEIESEYRRLVHPKWVDENGDDYSQELKLKFKSAIFQLLFKILLKEYINRVNPIKKESSTHFRIEVLLQGIFQDE